MGVVKKVFFFFLVFFKNFSFFYFTFHRCSTTNRMLSFSKQILLLSKSFFFPFYKFHHWEWKPFSFISLSTDALQPIEPTIALFPAIFNLNWKIKIIYNKICFLGKAKVKFWLNLVKKTDLNRSFFNLFVYFTLSLLNILIWSLFHLFSLL